MQGRDTSVEEYHLHGHQWSTAIQLTRFGLLYIRTGIIVSCREFIIYYILKGLFLIPLKTGESTCSTHSCKGKSEK